MKVISFLCRRLHRPAKPVAILSWLAIITLCSLGSSVNVLQAQLQWVTVGDAGNPPDIQGRGTVDANYRIGKFEVTNRQYAQFLNAVAQSDTFGLFDADMQRDPRGGIMRIGSPGAYYYEPKSFMDDKPVNFVSFYDTLRFANWMHNGRPAGSQSLETTEDGAYTLTQQGIAANSIVRNPGAKVFLPTLDEWIKAAFYEPGAITDDGDAYWRFATRSDQQPTPATADAGGVILNAGVNVANFDRQADWNGQDGNVTSVGTAGPESVSFYGAADMNGNVEEWTEDAISIFRGTAGGQWGNATLALTLPGLGSPRDEHASIGIRLAATPLVSGGLVGDFNGDRLLDITDVDLLIDAIRRQVTGGPFDIDTSGGTVDQQDLRFWVRNVKRTWLGDANLDGKFDSQDLIQLLKRGVLPQREVSSWADGDWDADGRFNTNDLIAAFQDGGFERPSTVGTPLVVPEPTSVLIPLYALVIIGFRTRKRIEEIFPVKT